MLRPGEESDSPPRHELLGAITSHGPFRESYTPARKSRAAPAEADGSPAADAPVFAQRMRAAVSPAAGAAALLQRPMPEGGAGMVALEGPAKIPDHRRRQTETERAKPAVPGESQKPETSRAGRSRSGRREGNHQRFFSTTVATAPAAMKDSFASHGRRCNDSARTSAGARWNASGNGSGGGNKRAPGEVR